MTDKELADILRISGQSCHLHAANRIEQLGAENAQLRVVVEKVAALSVLSKVDITWEALEVSGEAKLLLSGKGASEGS